MWDPGPDRGLKRGPGPLQSWLLGAAAESPQAAPCRLEALRQRGAAAGILHRRVRDLPSLRGAHAAPDAGLAAAAAVVNPWTVRGTDSRRGEDSVDARARE